MTDGSRHTWPAAASSGPPLELSLQLPVGWRARELTAPAGMESPAATALRRWGTSLEAITAQRLEATVEGADGSRYSVLASLTATLGGPLDPPATGGSDRAVVIGGVHAARRRVVRSFAGPSGSTVSMLVLRYLIDTPHGLLGVAFSSPQVVLHAQLEPCFEAIAATIRLTEASG